MSSLPRLEFCGSPITPCSARALRGLHKGLAYVIATAIGILRFARYPMFRPRVARSPQGARICHRYRDWYFAVRPSPHVPSAIAPRLRGFHKGLGYVIATAIGIY